MQSFENCAGRTVYAVLSVDRVRSRNADIIRIKLIANDINAKPVGNSLMICVARSWKDIINHCGSGCCVCI